MVLIYIIYGYKYTQHTDINWSDKNTVCFKVFLWMKQLILHSHCNCSPKVLIHSDQTRRDGNKFFNFHKEGSPKRLYNLHPWKYSFELWIRPWATWSNSTLTTSTSILDRVSSRGLFQSKLFYSILFYKCTYYLQNCSPNCQKGYSY